MIFTGLCRIGRDAEIRHTPSGDAVINLSLAYNYGMKPKDGSNKPSQWIDASLWGKQAEALCQYLKKGGLVDVVLQDLHIEEFDGKNGKQSKLVGRVLQIELAGSKSGDSAPAPQQQQSRATPADDFDSDVPF